MKIEYKYLDGTQEFIARSFGQRWCRSDNRSIWVGGYGFDIVSRSHVVAIFEILKSSGLMCHVQRHSLCFFDQSEIVSSTGSKQTKGIPDQNL